MLKYVIIGAGLAGLSAAVWLARKGHQVSLFEAAPYAGGRCRSWLDPVLDRVIDNGNHLVLHSNANTMRYLKWVDSDPTRNPFDIPIDGVYSVPGPIIIREPKTRIEYHVASNRPVTGYPLLEQMPVIKLMLFPARKTVSEFFDAESNFYKNIITPLCVSALNTPPETASAKLFAKVLRTFAIHSNPIGEFCLPVHTWGDALIDDGLKKLTTHGVEAAYKTSLKEIEIKDNKVARLMWQNGSMDVTPDMRIILAVPAWALGGIHPSLAVDLTYHPIVNGHFKVDGLTHTLNRDFIGLLGCHAHWLFFKVGLISTTTSAAESMLGLSHEEIASLLWKDIYNTLHTVPKTVPTHRIIVEKRATFAATPDNEAKRPSTRTAYSNLFLAGDYINTGLPPTIESAITSGFMAAKLTSKVRH
jgi:squalene-associated FAD-dependent desaturase